jgi:hypothetical protein
MTHYRYGHIQCKATTIFTVQHSQVISQGLNPNLLDYYISNVMVVYGTAVLTIIIIIGSHKPNMCKNPDSCSDNILYSIESL